MKAEEFYYIQVVADRYKNIYYPELAKHIEIYLSQNPDKIHYYVNCPFDNEVIVRKLVEKEFFRNEKNITTVLIMEEVSKFIERSFNKCN